MRNENSIFRSLEIIESRITEKMTVEDIAADIYISKHHYMRLFRETVGDSVMEYVTKRKLTLAGRALLETDMSILDIALDYGYDSRDGFSRSFKAYMGVTPTEYRKFGLTAISQKFIKGRLNMNYSKTTNEIIKELNDFIAKSRELAQQMRKTGPQEYAPFWNGVANHIDLITDNVHIMLSRINAIAEHPDEITNGFAVIKVIDDTTFEMILLGLQAQLAAARTTEYTDIYMPLAEKCRELAISGSHRAKKAHGFLCELSSHIISDMKKTAGQMIQNAIQKGKDTCSNLTGVAGYMKDELTRLVDELSAIPIETISVKMLDDCSFKVRIIALTAKINMFPNPDTVLTGINDFKKCLDEAIEFCNTIVKPPIEPSLEGKKIMALQDIVFQDNILRFYTKGEIEKLNAAGHLNDTQHTAFQQIDSKINDLIQIALDAERDAVDVSVFKEIASMSNEVVFDLNAEADKLGIHGGAIKLLTNEHRYLANRIMQCAKEIE